MQFKMNMEILSQRYILSNSPTHRQNTTSKIFRRSNSPKNIKQERRNRNSHAQK